MENGKGEGKGPMGNASFETLFTPDRLEALFPSERADQFFEALFGDAREGAYDIRLDYDGFQDNRLQFFFRLTERPGKCLSCSLTYGLPHVFSRHPVINVAGVVHAIDQLMNGTHRCADWEMGRTIEIDRRNHAVPLTIAIEPVG
jgi:hypothetical protein